MTLYATFYLPYTFYRYKFLFVNVIMNYMIKFERDKFKTKRQSIK